MMKFNLPIAADKSLWLEQFLLENADYFTMNGMTGEQALIEANAQWNKLTAPKSDTRRVTDTNRRFTVDLRRDHDGVDSLTVELFATVEGSEYRVAGYGLKPKHKALANRLGSAFVAKAIGKELFMHRRAAEIVREKNVPEFYVSTHSLPLGRTLNADLRKVGF